MHNVMHSLAPQALNNINAINENVALYLHSINVSFGNLVSESTTGLKRIDEIHKYISQNSHTILTSLHVMIHDMDNTIHIINDTMQHLKQAALNINSASSAQPLLNNVEDEHGIESHQGVNSNPQQPNDIGINDIHN